MTQLSLRSTEAIQAVLRQAAGCPNLSQVRTKLGPTAVSWTALQQAGDLTGATSSSSAALYEPGDTLEEPA